MMLHVAVATFYCLDIMSGQSEFWPDKCGKWPEIGQWPAAISSSGMHVLSYMCISMQYPISSTAVTSLLVDGRDEKTSSMLSKT